MSVTEMSDIDSPTSSRSEDRYEDIDIDLLIAEVKKRPPLYLSTPKELDWGESQRQWAEVCQVIFQQWNDFEPTKKKEKAKDVETKWGKLRDSFYKKFGGADTYTPSGKKKRKYYYFDSLSFLIPTMAEQHDAILDNNNELEIAFETVDEPRRKTPDISNAIPSSTKTIPILEQPWEFSEIKPTPEIATPQIIEQRDDIDENTHFALMLVPMMQKFNDEQRYHARVAILRSMRQIRLMGQKKISILQEELKYSEEPGVADLMPDLNYPMPEEAPFDDGQEYPAPAPIVIGRPTNSQGEIEYPETDTEDVDI